MVENGVGRWQGDAVQTTEMPFNLAWRNYRRPFHFKMTHAFPHSISISISRPHQPLRALSLNKLSPTFILCLSRSILYLAPSSSLALSTHALLRTLLYLRAQALHTTFLCVHLNLEQATVFGLAS